MGNIKDELKKPKHYVKKTFKTNQYSTGIILPLEFAKLKHPLQKYIYCELHQDGTLTLRWSK